MTDNNYDDDSVEQGPLSRLEDFIAPASRRRFMTTTAKVGGVLALAGAGTGTAAAGDSSMGDDGEHENENGDDGDDGEMDDSDSDDDVSDLDVLNYALTLEHLEAAYYNEFLSEYSEKEVERSEAARVFADKGSRFGTYQRIETVRDHEEAHVEALTATIEDLGGEPVEPLDYEFPYESVEEFAALSAQIESVGVSAYAGAAPLIEDEDLIPPALSIHSVEARHTAYFNVLNTTNPFPNAFDPARSMEEVLEIASQFIVGMDGDGGGTLQAFMPSVISLDAADQTVTLPLYRGTHDGEDVYYIVTESSDEDDAEQRGVNHAPKFANVLGTDAVQEATVEDDVVEFSGTVDFSLTREVVPGPEGFPPDDVQPGSEGDGDYSPLVTTDDEIVLNASQVRNDTGDHSSVTDIDTEAMTVTLEMLAGFYEDERVLYLGMDSSSPVVAALEKSTLAPNLDAAPGLASNDDTSARSAIIPIVNGPRGSDNPERQGLQSAVLGEGDPLNITQSEPGDDDYSPVWDVHPAVWTDEAIDDGERVRLVDHEDVADRVEEGLIVSGGAGPANSSLGALQAAEFISNCPMVAVFEEEDGDQEGEEDE